MSKKAAGSGKPAATQGPKYCVAVALPHGDGMKRFQEFCKKNGVDGDSKLYKDRSIAYIILGKDLPDPGEDKCRRAQLLRTLMQEAERAADKGSSAGYQRQQDAKKATAAYFGTAAELRYTDFQAGRRTPMEKLTKEEVAALAAETAAAPSTVFPTVQSDDGAPSAGAAVHVTVNMDTLANGLHAIARSQQAIASAIYLHAAIQHETNSSTLAAKDLETRALQQFSSDYAKRVAAEEKHKDIQKLKREREEEQASLEKELQDLNASLKHTEEDGKIAAGPKAMFIQYSKSRIEAVKARLADLQNLMSEVRTDYDAACQDKTATDELTKASREKVQQLMGREVDSPVLQTLAKRPRHDIEGLFKTHRALFGDPITQGDRAELESTHSSAICSEPTPGGATGSEPTPSGATGSEPTPGGATGSEPTPGGATASEATPGGTTGSEPTPGGATGSEPTPGGVTGSEPTPGGTTGSEPTPGGTTGSPVHSDDASSNASDRHSRAASRLDAIRRERARRTRRPLTFDQQFGAAFNQTLSQVRATSASDGSA